MQVTKLDVACAWSVAFILLHSGARQPTDRLLATYGPSFTRDQMVKALWAATKLGVVTRVPLSMFEANRDRAKDILQWHDWADVGLGSEPDPREALYDTLLDKLVEALNQERDPAIDPGVLQLTEELERTAPPPPVVTLLHRKPPRNSFVYFIQMGDDGPIKIGWALDVKKRLLDLQCGSPFELRLLLSRPGCDVEEGLLHRRFARSRLRGEWFRPSPEVLAFIESKPDSLYDTCTDRLGWTAPMTWPPEVEGAVRDYLARTLKRLTSCAQRATAPSEAPVACR